MTTQFSTCSVSMANHVRIIVQLVYFITVELGWIFDIKVVFRPLGTLRHMLVHPKDPVPLDQQKGCVYSIPCDGCPKVYIGQTGRTLKHRLAEHRQALKNGDVAAPALAEHTLDTDHPLDLTKAEVIDHHPHTMTWCLQRAGRRTKAHWQRERHPALDIQGTLRVMYFRNHMTVHWLFLLFLLGNWFC